MTHRYISLGLVVISLVAIPIGYFLLHPSIIGFCPKNIDTNCLNEAISFGVGKPLFWSIWPLSFLFLGLAFVKKEVFALWWKIILPVTLLGFYFIAISPPLHDFLIPGRTEVTALVVKIIILISILAIAWKYWRLSRIPKGRSTIRK